MLFPKIELKMGESCSKPGFIRIDKKSGGINFSGPGRKMKSRILNEAVEIPNAEPGG
jgi:hypothetical protein